MFSPALFRRRREALLQALAAEGARGLAVLPGHGHAPMNYADNVYDFRQDASFLYFCGLDTPGLALLIDLDSGETTLFGTEAGIDDLVWTGPVPRLDERAALAGITLTAAADQLDRRIATARAQGRTLHLLPAYRGETRIAQSRWTGLPDPALDSAVSEPLTRAVIGLRAIKGAEEIAEIEDALGLTRELHLLAMRMARPGVVEQQIVGAMEGHALAQGRRLAYAPIFSSRGEILHNHDHSVRLQGGELIVNDTGAQSARGYASDITRTLIVGGVFSPLQAGLYDLVLQAQTAAIAAVAPGTPYREVHETACRVMVAGMVDLGFMRGDPAEAVACGAHAIFFQCGTGHQMGLDVHDMEGLGEHRVGYGEGFVRSPLFGHKSLRMAKALQPGMVVTVEPGIYINPWLTAQWRSEQRHVAFIDYDMFERHARLGGIRLEDDVLVTADGRRELGPAIPRTRAEVAALCGT